MFGMSVPMAFLLGPLFDEMPVALALSRRADGTFLRVNARFHKMLGYTVGEMLGRNSFELHLMGAGQRDELLDIIEHEQAVRDFELTLHGKDRRQIVVLTNVVPLTVEDEACLLISNIDITDRKRLEQEVKDRTVDLEQAVQNLQTALDDVRTLSGLLPVCAWCHKMRSDLGYWQHVDEYLQEHTDLELTHGICPDCMRSHFPHTRRPSGKAPRAADG